MIVRLTRSADKHCVYVLEIRVLLRRHHLESTQLKVRLRIQAQSRSGLLKERGEDAIVCTIQSNNIRRRSIALEDRYSQWCLHLVCGLEVSVQSSTWL
jgi:hypothetical protein